MVWKHLNLPDPTPIQYDIASYIQSDVRRSIIMAFRGVGKSYVTSAYVVHQLLLDPQLKVLVVSASKQRSDDFSTFTQRLIMEMPVLSHLIAREGQRQSKIAFDVAPAQASHSPSVKSVGITGQLAGSRADLIIADDIEIPNNSATQQMREKLSEAVKEFDAILKPDGRIMFLGTPQTEMTLYALLQERGYDCRVWTGRYPSEDKIDKYSGTLAPFIEDKLLRKPALCGSPTDPLRFDDEDLLERELSYGRSGFALQYMLDTSLSDSERYPLKLSDIVCMALNSKTAPEGVVWSKSPTNRLSELPMVGLAGDGWYSPMDIQGSWIPYQGSVLAIDPSGRGQDELGYAVVKMLNGYLFVVECGGLIGGYDEKTLQQLADIAKRQSVNFVITESNFGDGMFTELLKPFLTRTYPVTIEEVRHSKQKELRIIDTLEPIMNQHKLIVCQSVVENDWKTIQQYPTEKAQKYSLFYQMTRVTKERGAIAHDDRLDALAMAVAYWVDQVAADAEMAIAERRSEMMDLELGKFLEGTENHKMGVSAYDGARKTSLTWM